MAIEERCKPHAVNANEKGQTTQRPRKIDESSESMSLILQMLSALATGLHYGTPGICRQEIDRCSDINAPSPRIASGNTCTETIACQYIVYTDGRRYR